MAKRRKGTQTPKKRQQLSRVRRFISRAEKRGYRFPEELKKELAGMSTQRLKRLTPEKLYKMATAISEETGKVVSGTTRRKEARREAAKKAAETRRFKRDLPRQGEIIWTKINNLIDSYNTAGAQYMRDLLAQEVRKFGKKAVLQALAESGEEAISAAETIIYYQDTANTISRAFRNLGELIRSYAPTEAESREMGKAIDAL